LAGLGVIALQRAARGVLIVVPALNEAETIVSVVEHALQELNGLSGLVAVADGGSSDGTRELVAGLAAANEQVKLVDNPDRLQSAGINAAVERYGSSFRYLLRVDAHGAFPRGYVRRLVVELEEQAASSVVVPMRTVPTGGGFQRAVAIAQNSTVGTGGAAHRRAESEGRWVAHGHHAAFTMSAFQAVGGYDPTFSHNEDAEFDVRLRAAGGRIWMSASTVFDYYPRSTPRALWRQYLQFGGGRARTVLKHRQIEPRQLVAAAVGPVVVAPLLVRKAPFIWLPALLWSGATGAAAMRRAAERPQEVAPVWMAMATMHLAWSAGFWLEVSGALVRGRSRYRRGARHV
jgi:succinoglycan biosynthesis protein ExoA